MSVVAAIATANEVIGLANGVRELVNSAGLDRRRLRPVLNALDKLYFTPNGILTILRDLSTGNQPDPDQVSDALIAFNDGEGHVQAAVGALDFSALPAEHFPLRLRSLLQSAAYGKLSLRRDLQDFLNIPSGELRIDPEIASELLARVISLNAELEALDEQLR